MFHLNPKRRKEALTLVAVFVIVLLASAFAVYLLAGRTTPDTPRTDQPGVRMTEPDSRATRSPEQPAQPQAEGFFGELLNPQTSAQVSGESWGEVVANLALRLLLAALLGAALAFRPKRRILSIKRNPYVAQTQILLAVVASALMMIVGDNAARAFGIFAAVSLVRFRTNIRDPKEITVLLISLALGLATGVGRWDLAMVLALFSLMLLWVLEYREPEQVFRSMELKINTKDVAPTHEAVRDIFERHGFVSELRALGQASQEDPNGSIIYAVDIPPNITTDELSEEILAKDAARVLSVEWDQKKSFSYLYQ